MRVWVSLQLTWVAPAAAKLARAAAAEGVGGVAKVMSLPLSAPEVG